MAYIGRNLEQFSNVEKLDNITFTNSAGPYNLLKGAVAFVPVNAQSLLIEVDGIIQASDSYTVSGSTITFLASMASTSTMNSIVQLGVGLISTPADDTVSTAKLEDGAVTGAKVNSTFDVSAKTVTLPASVSGLGTGITNAQLAGSIDVTSKITGIVPPANLGTGTASASTYLAGDGSYKALSEYDDNTVQSNIALLGFKVAVNGSLTRYNLKDQSIDEFYDTSGIDASTSTNDDRVASGSNYYYRGAVATTPPSGGDSTDTTVSGYTSKVFTSTGTGTLTVTDSGDVDVLVVAGGGSGGFYYGGGGGAGGLVYKSGVTLTASTTYDAIIGAGGAANTTNANSHGFIGSDSTFGPNGGSVLFTGKGGGGGGDESDAGQDGGSGGGASYIPTSGFGGDETQSAVGGDSSTYGFGNDAPPGWHDAGWSKYYPSGGGGAGGSPLQPTDTLAGNGGAGKDYSSIFGTVVGDSGWFASGGGGGKGSTGASPIYGVASAGGGGDGSTASGNNGSPGMANTGGGGGGGGTPASNPGPTSGAGGSGVVIVRWADNEFLSIGDLTLQSTDVTASSSPTYGEFVTLIENAYGTATLNTDIKGYISRDSGATFTQGTLVDEGTWGTNKKVLGFHDLALGGSASTAMCYKITTHNQVASSKETRVYATSIGWR